MSQVQINQSDVLLVAEELFQTYGFEQTTLDDIAQKANIPVAMLEQEYACKEQLALSIYESLSEISFKEAQTIEASTLSEMYYAVLEQRLLLLDQHAEVSSILFAMAMRPQSQVTASDLARGKRDPIMQAMQVIVDNATNKPKHDAENLTLFLYAFHFLVIVFWLYDRTDDKEASHMLTTFMRDLVKMMRPMLVLPMVAKALTKVSKIIMTVFGGARIVH